MDFKSFFILKWWIAQMLSLFDAITLLQFSILSTNLPTHTTISYLGAIEPGKHLVMICWYHVFQLMLGGDKN